MFNCDLYRMNAQSPGLKGVPGTTNQWICYEFITYICSSVTNIGGNNLKN